MQRLSPPKHRHDGTSPLPLGMDWSPPPKKWAGHETVWPHDPRTGWSYCVTIPSWVVRPKSRDSDPIVFYRVLVGIQSPEGITNSRMVFRRFNDFLKFHSALKNAFPQKSLPPAPPKGLLRMKTRALLEERRRSLEEWMTKLLSDIEISRSFIVASFLELEAAARSSFQDENQQSSGSDPSASSIIISSSQIHPNSSLSMLAGSSSLASDSDTAYEASDFGSASLGRDNYSEVGTEDLSFDEDLTSPIDKFMKYGMSNIDEGLFMGQAILEQLQGFPKHKPHAREVSSVAGKNRSDENGQLTPKFSGESSGSDVSSQKGCEPSNLAVPGMNENGPNTNSRGAEISRTTENLGNTDLQLPDDVHLLLPVDQRQKINRVLMTMQRRLLTAKTDMEDLLSRLNQEIAVKEYLATKVKDLEVELESTKQKSKENIEQAILIERERVTQMQWDMEELRRKSLEMEMKLKSPQDQMVETVSTNLSNSREKDPQLQELDATREQLEDLSKRYQELERKSKADIKILVKEVKSLRGSQAALKEQLNQSLKEKSEIEVLLQEEKHKNDHMNTWWRNLPEKCETLHNQLQDCRVKFLVQDENDQVTDLQTSSLPLDHLAEPEDQINLLLAEVQKLSLNVDQAVSAADNLDGNNDDPTTTKEDFRDLRTALVKLFVEYGRLVKQVNSVTHYALRMKLLPQRDSEASSDNTLQNAVMDK